MAELERDPKFRVRTEQQQRDQRQNAENYSRAAAPIVAELRSLGFAVSSIGDLRRTKRVYKRAIPLLLAWVSQVSDRSVKEDLIRTLSVPWANPEAAPVLIREFKKADDTEATDLRWVIGNALEVVADDSHFSELAELAQDRKYGRAREMVVLALAKMKRPDSQNVLLRLLSDPQVDGHAVHALVKMKAAVEAARVEPFLKHPKRWVRQEAKKLLRYAKGAKKARN
jgi:hypothetical protein